MKKLRLLKQVLVRTQGDKMLISFLIFLLLDALVIFFAEPTFETYGDSVWYCYAVITTIGFGDLVVTTTLAKICTMLLSLYSILIIAIITGIVVNYYTELLKVQQNESVVDFLDKAEHLSDLSKEELDELSRKISELRMK